MVFTVQFSFPSAKANDERSQIREVQEHGLFLHGITGASFVHVLLRNALERLCAPAQSESFKRRRVEPSDCKEKRAVRATDVSVLRALGLPEDDKTSDNLLLRIYERRLRNESTPKYLDWWSRKGSSMEQSVSNVPEAPAPIVPQHVLDVVSTLRPSSSQAVDSPLTNDALRVYVKVPVHATLEALLRALPETFGVVEYPEMELWHPEALAAAERRNQVRCPAMQLLSHPVKIMRCERAPHLPTPLQPLLRLNHAWPRCRHSLITRLLMKSDRYPSVTMQQM